MNSRSLLQLWLLLALTSTVATRSAFANSMELFGGSARAASMGSAVSAWADDYTALWHNPAGLALSQPHMAVGMALAFDQVGIRLKPRPAGYDLPDLGNDSATVPTSKLLAGRSDTTGIPDSYDFRLGAVGSLGLDKLRFGVALSLPMTRLGMQRTRFADEREQYVSNRLDFELLGSRSQHQVILLGVGYPVLSWLSLGGGFSILPSGHASSSVYLNDPVDQANARLAVDNEQVGRMAPHLGALVHGEKWRAGLAWRSASYFPMVLQNSIQINGFQTDPDSFPIRQDVTLRMNYSPDQLALGGAVWLGPTTVVAEAMWSRWSGYVDTQNEPAGFNDTLSLRAGLEHRADSDRRLRVGLQWEPSPVPEQTGRTNYVDNSRIVATTGATHGLELFGRALEVDWYVQVHHLLPRDTNKAQTSPAPACGADVTVVCDEIPDDTVNPTTGQKVAEYQGLQTGNPGFPGWTSWGDLLAVGVDMRWRF